MIIDLPQLYKNFDKAVDDLRKMTTNFCDRLGITTFGYVRVFHTGMISWITTNPEQDCFLVESGTLNKNPLVDTGQALKEGCYLDNNALQFPGREDFLNERAKRFQMDHGMIVVRHQKDYLETCCFSGLTTKRCLYPLFMNEQPLFRTFMEHFTSHLDTRLTSILEDGIPLSKLKDEYGVPKLDGLTSEEDRAALVEACGWKHLLKLSKREKQCLGFLKEGYTYQEIGIQLGLSERTVEHYLESVRNKLGLESRVELFVVAEKLKQLHLL